MLSFKKTDVVEEKRIEKEAQESIKAVGNAARACLSTEQFKTYRSHFEHSEKKMVDALLMLTKSFEAGSFDLSAYGSKVLVYMTRLKDLRILLDVVEADAKKGKDEPRAE